MYQSNYAKILKIGVTGNVSENIKESFIKLLNDNIFDSIKICHNFSLKTDLIEADMYSQYNFVFYVTSLDDMYEKKKDTIIINNNLVSDIHNITSKFSHPRNHLFIIVDGCQNMEIDDDGDLKLSDEKEFELYKKLEKKISTMISEDLYHNCRICITMSNIWKLILDDSSIVNLTENQIDKLSSVIIPKSSKMAITEKKRAIKTFLKKVEIADKIAETGYTELSEIIMKYFKLIHQKKLVCQNYLFEFDNLNISLNRENVNNIDNLVKEVYDISYLKTEMYDELIDKIDEKLLKKLESFYSRNNHNDAHTYHNFLSQIMEISNGYNLSTIKELTQRELDKVNNIIVDYHNKEVEKITDLEKISNFLEIMATTDKNNLLTLFHRLKSNPKIMSENIEKMDKWIYFIDKCLKLGISKNIIIQLMEEIIVAKILYHVNMSAANGMENSSIYPQCLHVFLTHNLDHFILKKLYMFNSCTIRYSGRNITEFIKNLTEDKYRNLLSLEYRLLALCNSLSEELSQTINPSTIDIVETFNEKPNAKETNSKKDKK